MNGYFWIERKSDDRRVCEWRGIGTPKRSRKPRPGHGGNYMVSTSMAVPIDQLADAQRLDRKLGVNADYEVRGKVAYKTFPYPGDDIRWMKAHKWVSHDPGYRYPVPGDFGGNTSYAS